eukprot:6179794-Pleurochrysis_carterae.AAC.2
MGKGHPCRVQARAMREMKRARNPAACDFASGPERRGREARGRGARPGACLALMGAWGSEAAHPI